VGGKQTRRRKHVYVYIAVLILANLLGCRLQTVQQDQGEARPGVITDETPVVKEEPGEVKPDVSRDEKPEAAKPSVDQGLFSMALRYADTANPGRDYAKAAQYLRRLLKEYPASPLAGQAKVLLGLLQELDQMKRAMDKVNAMMEESKKVDVEIEQKRKEMQK
jgi:TolA-binding protein